MVSIERDAQKQAMARQNLDRARLQDRVDLRLGDATTLVREMSGPIDLVFFDADRVSAPEQLQLLLPKLSPRALVLADNVLSHPQEIAAYLEFVSNLAEFEHSVIPVGKGLSVACRVAPAFKP